MMPLQEIVVSPLNDRLLPRIIDIHIEGLGYTLNSRLGREHLRFLYESMASDARSYVGVALMEGQAAGIVSGTLDEDGLKSRLMSSMGASRLAGLGLRLLTRPGLIAQWLQSFLIAWPVYCDGEEVSPVLTALAVSPECQGRGVGQRLVGALEAFFGSNHVHRYRLDTLITNSRARGFYDRLGFSEVARRMGSIILVRTIGPP